MPTCWLSGRMHAVWSPDGPQVSRTSCMPVSLGMSVPGISAGTGQCWCLVAPGDSLHARPPLACLGYDLSPGAASTGLATLVGLIRSLSGREAVTHHRIAVGAGIPQPPGLGGESHQGLHHGQGDQFSTGQLRADGGLRPVRGKLRRFLQQIVGLHIQCGREGVHVSRHNLILGTLASCSAEDPLE